MGRRQELLLKVEGARTVSCCCAPGKTGEQCEAHYYTCGSCRNRFFRNGERALSFLHKDARFIIPAPTALFRPPLECDGCTAKRYVAMLKLMEEKGLVRAIPASVLSAVDEKEWGYGYTLNLRVNWNRYKAELKKHRRKRGMNTVPQYNLIGKFADLLCATGVLVPRGSEMLASWHILGEAPSGDKMFFGPIDYGDRVLGFKNDCLNGKPAQDFAKVMMKRDFTAYRKWEILMCGDDEKRVLAVLAANSRGPVEASEF